VSSPQVAPTLGHLEYYEQHGISPVHYIVNDLEAHFDRREFLYRMLGLPPIAFRNSRVLEVAPGSGQNSLYLSICAPVSLDLVEPNAAARRDLEAVYADIERPCTKPTVHSMRFETFHPPSTFDVVICENWLGALPREVALIRKLAGLVAPGGVLVLTIVPLSGFFANVMRKLLALRLDDPALGFGERTERLLAAFGPHLATLANMTRNHRDWVQDCLLNPHYLNVALPLETVIEAVGEKLDVLSTFPRFGQDWRWFKGLTRDTRHFNELALATYHENTHNFVDYRKILPSRDALENAALEATFCALHCRALEWQDAAGRGRGQAAGAIDALLQELRDRLTSVDCEIGAAIDEVHAIWSKPTLDISDVRDMRLFARLFGRETVYVSFARPRSS
jgi:SAM-dependent methyltransferase